MRSVVQSLAGTPVPEPVPVVMHDVVLVFPSRSRPLPEIPVQPFRYRNGLAGTDRRPVVHIPRLRIVHLADGACLEFIDSGNHIGPGPSLVADLDYGAVFRHGPDKHVILCRIVACRLLKIYMFSGLHRHDGRRSMPVVRHGDYDGIDILRFQQSADILLSCRSLAGNLPYRFLTFCDCPAVHIAYPGDFTVFQFRKAGSKAFAAGIDPDHSYPYPVIGSNDPACRIESQRAECVAQSEHCRS